MSIGRILRPSEVTPEMANWAATLLSQSMGDTIERMFGTVDITARVETHVNGTAADPLPHSHKGITLYHTTGNDPAVVLPTSSLLPEGIDLHAGQWPVDWSQVMASGRTFAYIKATEGVTVTDGRLRDHHEGAGAVGFKRGVYHFFRARDGAEQIDHFLSVINGFDWELPLVIDVEMADGQSLEVCASRMVECFQAFVEPFMIYTMPGFWNTIPIEAGELPNAQLWVATWGPKPIACRNLPAPVMWQYSASASVPGYPGHADVNRVLNTDWWASL